MIFLWLSAILMVATSVTHSVLGEKRLIGPVLAIDSDIMRRSLARTILRLAWHLTSLFMLLTALLIVWPGTPRTLVLITGVLWLAVGLIDGVMTKGQHIGWGPLTVSGALAIAGVVG
jgi:hypothetical protein